MEQNEVFASILDPRPTKSRHGFERLLLMFLLGILVHALVVEWVIAVSQSDYTNCLKRTGQHAQCSKLLEER